MSRATVDRATGAFRVAGAKAFPPDVYRFSL